MFSTGNHIQTTPSSPASTILSTNKYDQTSQAQNIISTKIQTTTSCIYLFHILILLIDI